MAAIAPIVGLHQAIEAYHEAVRGAKAGEALEGVREHPVQADAGGDSASSPSRSVCSGSACAIATRGVVSADAKRQPDVAMAASSASAGRQRDHRTPTRWRPQRARHPASPRPGAFPSAWVLHTGASRPDIGQQRRHHSRRYKLAHAQLAPIHGRRVRAWFAHASQHAAPPTAKHRPECAVLPHRTCNLRPPPVAICDSSRRKSTRSGRWSFPEQSAESTTSTRDKEPTVNTTDRNTASGTAVPIGRPQPRRRKKGVRRRGHILMWSGRCGSLRRLQKLRPA